MDEYKLDYYSSTIDYADHLKTVQTYTDLAKAYEELGYDVYNEHWKDLDNYIVYYRSHLVVS